MNSHLCVIVTPKSLTNSLKALACPGQAGDVTILPSTTTSSYPTFSYTPPYLVTSNLQAG